MEKLSRKQIILKLIVEEFIKTAHPVGSNTLIEEYNLTYSSATIRNEMFELEEEGFIEKPHTSAGRVPSSKGYRYYIENLREVKGHAEDIKAQIKKVIKNRAKNSHTDLIIDECCEIISNMTNLVSIIMGPNGSKEKICKVQLIPLNNSTAVCVFVTDSGYVEHQTINVPSGNKLHELEDCIKIINKRIKGVSINEIEETLNSIRLVLSEHITNFESLYNVFAKTFLKFANERISYYGKGKLLSQDDFSNIEKMRKVAVMLENNSIWKAFDSESEGINISIGEESKINDLSDISIVSTKLQLTPLNKGTIAVIGPTRMDYSTVIESLEYLTSQISELINKENEND